MKLKSLLFVALLFPVYFGHAQNTHKTKNVVLILIDGYRWQELFNGADFNLHKKSTKKSRRQKRQRL